MKVGRRSRWIFALGQNALTFSLFLDAHFYRQDHLYLVEKTKSKNPRAVACRRVEGYPAQIDHKRPREPGKSARGQPLALIRNTDRTFSGFRHVARSDLMSVCEDPTADSAVWFS